MFLTISLDNIIEITSNGFTVTSLKTVVSMSLESSVT